MSHDAEAREWAQRLVVGVEALTVQLTQINSHLRRLQPLNSPFPPSPPPRSGFPQPQPETNPRETLEGIGAFLRGLSGR